MAAGRVLVKGEAMINIEYFASKVRREHDPLNEEVPEGEFVPTCRRQPPLSTRGPEVRPDAGSPDLERAS